ncbi:hypothetical protein P2G88_09795 [Aliiglaciecola sp. CAU 1673]|uniref:hypothetical protein n=1 Tax=Aliiglaciecola sp. CAU 1673 TaxID=3032595 RepID=UPI0023DA9DFC|nr:hypothetical protein [Aliiglaciecola sp. CAU 1673]MDF2178546.1 hypothetical protein [Aliiglaciecola sp. CAU 1673]
MRAILFSLLLAPLYLNAQPDWRLGEGKGDALWEGGWLEYDKHRLQTAGLSERQRYLTLQQDMGDGWVLLARISSCRDGIVESANQYRRSYWRYEVQPMLELQNGVAVGVGTQAYWNSRVEFADGQRLPFSQGQSFYLSTKLGHSRDAQQWELRLSSDRYQAHPLAGQSSESFQQNGFQVAYSLSF